MPILHSLPLPTMTNNKGRALFSRTTVAAFMAAMLSFATPHAMAQGKPAPAEKAAPPAAADKETVTLNFVNADLVQVIKTVGMITGKNFLIDPRVTGTVNIISNGPVAKELVYPIMLSALRLQGFAAVEEQGFVKIVPEADAKLNYSITTDKPIKGGGDKIVTQVYQLQYENAAQLLPVLRPLISPNNVIAAYPNNNTLVITDYAENIRRINKIIQSIDQPTQGEITQIKLEHASAVDVAQLLSKLMPEAGAQQGVPGATPKLLLTVDPRSNIIFVRSENPSYVSRVRALVTGMDTPAAASGNIHVVYLRNAEATKVAETLRGLLSGQSQSQSQTSLGATPAASFAPTPGGAGGVAAQPVAASSSPQAVSSTIQAYPATNSLVIIAPDHLYNQLRSVIDKLDARRAQVFVEALIVEVSDNVSGDFGVQFQNLLGINKDGTNAIGGTNFGARGGGTNIIDLSQSIGSASTGLNLGVVRGMVNIPGIGPIINLGVLARALESHGKTNILSTPNILTLDNEEAKIVVGQNVPFITGSFSQASGTTAGTVNPFQTIDRKDVGLTLKVKPTVAEGGSIKMQFYQEVSSVDTSNTVNTGGAGVVTNKRSIESTVLVDDGQIIVLGGLIQDNSTNSRSQVPVLGSIPIFPMCLKESVGVE